LALLYHWEHNREVFASMKACDGGDVFVNVLNVKETHASIEKHIHGVAAAGARPILVGGDHSITLPILRALRKTAKKPIALFHLDAHADTYGPAWGEDLHHGTFVRHAVDEKLIDPTKSVQLGLRGGIADPEDYRYSEDQKFTLIPAQEIHLRGAAWVTQQIQGWKKRIGNAPVYISFDIDGVDPAFAPGTGTPVPGGLSSWQALHVLQSLRGVNLIGADLVEIAPMYDPAQVTSLLAMSILFEMAALMAAVV
jgi:guanidinobutyrase